MPSDLPPCRTIPGVLRDAARRDPGGIWVRTDDGELSFGGALSQVAAAAGGLRAAGVGHGDLVLVTTRTTPEYLICWLALAALGAVTVSANPRSAPAELAGLARQVRPRALITDPGLAGLVEAAGIAGLPPLGTLPAGELAGGWAGAGARRSPPTCRTPGSPRTTWPCSSPPRAPPAGRSWSCRRTGPTCWPARASRTGWG